MSRDGHNYDCRDCVRSGKAKGPRELTPEQAAKDKAQRAKPHRRAANRRAVKIWTKRNPGAAKARAALRGAVRRGIVKPAAHCQAKGCTSAHRLEAHHHNYREPTRLGCALVTIGDCITAAISSSHRQRRNTSRAFRTISTKLGTKHDHEHQQARTQIEHSAVAQAAIANETARSVSSGRVVVELASTTAQHRASGRQRGQRSARRNGPVGRLIERPRRHEAEQ